MKATVVKCLNFNACQCDIVLIPRSPLKCSFEFRQSSREDGIVVAPSHQEIAHIDSDESNKLSTIHEHEGTLIELVLNPPSFCQVTNNSFPPSSWRVSETEHRSFQFQHLFSRDLQFVAHLLWRLCMPLHHHKTERLSSHHPFLKRKPRDAESCKMSCLERRLCVGDSERISVKSGSV